MEHTKEDVFYHNGELNGYSRALKDVLQLLQLQDEPVTVLDTVHPYNAPTFSPVASGRNKLRQELRQAIKEMME